MTTGSALETTSPDGTRKLALLKAVGLDRLAPEQRELALNIAQRYELDLLLKHLVMIEGRPYVTRDGLLHIAHRSGQLDGIETTEPEVRDGYWRATCSVYRRDMSRPFTYYGRYPTSGGNQKFAPEMATKVAEVMALRRAFDVSAPTAEERWDVAEVPAAVEPPAPTTLAERVAAKRAAVTAAPTNVGMGSGDNEADTIAQREAFRKSTTPVATAPDPTAVTTCGDEDASPMGMGFCTQPGGHTGAHKNANGSWPR
jgi:hypothetical protein